MDAESVLEERRQPIFPSRVEWCHPSGSIPGGYAEAGVLTQALERWYHVAEHLSDAQRQSASCLGNRIVQVKDVDRASCARPARSTAAGILWRTTMITQVAHTRLQLLIAMKELLSDNSQ